MILLWLALGVLGLWVMLNQVAWFVTSRDLPWSWRTCLGPKAYFNWVFDRIERNSPR